MSRENVKSDRGGFVRRIEEHDIIDAFLGNATDYLVDQVPVWIEHGEPVAVLDVLNNHIQEQRGFAAARGTDQMHVANSLLGAHRNAHDLAGMMILAERECLAEGEGGWSFCLAFLALQL